MRSLRAQRLRSAIARQAATCFIRSRTCVGALGRVVADDPRRRPAPRRGRRSRRRWASWVTITTVWPNSSTARRSSASTSSLELRVEVAGRLVGEHDRRLRDQRPRDRDALLLAARELGRADGRAGRRGRPRRRAGRSARGRASRPASDSGSRMFSSALSTGSRLKNWKTKPILSRRSSVSSASSSSPSSTPSIVTEPEVGRSSPARQCISVDLPEPDGPMIAVKRALREARR